MLREFADRHVLLLQGPMGPFFARLGADLRAVGARVSKINFNAGDALFFRGPHATSYRGSLDGWRPFLERFVREREVDAILLFGDCRPYHVVAKHLAEAAGIKVFVFEEGYLRPDYITFERAGVNKNSRMSRDPAFYRHRAPKDAVEATPVGNIFWCLAFYSIVYALACTFFGWLYPRYRHHKDVNAFRQAYVWARSGLRKLRYRRPERRLLERLRHERSKRYFLAPLQVVDDYQMLESRFRDVPEFIREVTASFAKDASADEWLVFKHHPLDRGWRDYRQLIDALAKEHRLEGRLHYVHDLHLPTLLRHARGVIVVNSTVGLSALYHGTPCLVLDRSVYDFLTHPGDLASFWTNPKPAHPVDYAAFHRWLRANVLVGGSFYRAAPPGSRFRSAEWPSGRESSLITPFEPRPLQAKHRAPAAEGV